MARKKQQKKITKIEATKQMIRKEKKRRLKVAGYARVSSDCEEQQNSYQAQLDYYRNMIKSRWNWSFVKMYSDEGISGTSADIRPGFKAMIDDALAGKIDLIITKSVSRFARNTVDSLSAIRRLKNHGVEVFFEKENIWTFDSKGELLITIMSSLAQEESRSISENIRWGWKKSFSDGNVPWGSNRPYGYRRTAGGNIVINSKEADVVRFIFHRYFEGWNPTTICRSLEREGIPAPRGGSHWNESTVIGILHNERYSGDAILQKTYTVDFLDKKRKPNNGELPKWIVENNHPAIISKTAFALIPKIDELNRKRGVVNHNHPLAGKIYCGLCNNPMKHRLVHNRTRYQKQIWYCDDKSHGMIRVNQSDLLQAMSKELKTLVLSSIDRVPSFMERNRRCNKAHRNSHELLLVRYKELPSLLEQEPLQFEELFSSILLGTATVQISL